MENLKQIAKQVRRNILEMVAAGKSGHPGGSLSAVEILTALYFHEMNIDPKDPRKKDRDRFILSKGHATPVLYGVLAERGFFPREEIKGFRKINSLLQGHPDMKNIPGVDMSSGSLGQGLSVANGMAIAGKLDNIPYYVYVLLGDGEIQEGQVWEAAMTAAHYKLDNVIAFLDYNGLQIDGDVEDVMGVTPIDKKWEAFNWHVQVIDGHNYDEILTAIEKAKNTKGKPSIIIAKTVKGKGVSFMENKAEWHGTAPNEEQLQQALKELE
ncbi:transketolase [Anaerobranca californiensis DSM 14826]|uniref:Transketolase n=1 Tax=Anaerobranca californiensis DSM 14826 TaxID=1120989 RepID=A0A1M6PD10_9FIRM|nr:transketolase [Anaerobranca californiensis]SHK05826.1 transketolase [Anaerobranca californiensis DSM 14826]